jgi:hypothetical protein
VRRTFGILLSFALSLGLITAVAAWRFGRAVRPLGSASLSVRSETLVQLAKPPMGPAPLVAWLGDSTILSTPEIVSYPHLIAGIRSWPINGQGFDPYGFYLFLEPVLAQRPALVAIVANLRVLGGPWPRDMTSLADQLPLRELPSASLLPWHSRGLSLPRLLLNRALAWPPVLAAITALEGFRRRHQEASYWKHLDLTPKPEAITARFFFLGVSTMLRSYDMPISQRTPSVRMLDACIERIRSVGSKVLVIVTPIPTDTLRTQGWYDPKRNRARVDALRRHWQSMGAEVVDLHDYLAKDLFADNSGHTTADGHQVLATRIQGEVHRLVDGAATAPLP